MDMHAREAERLHALRQLNLLDTPPSESFDRITRMASQLFGLPIAAVSLTDADRQWFKSRVGIEHWSIPRMKAPCAEVAEETELLVIPDLLASPCYRDSLLAKSGIRFYAGAPLITAQGHGLGAMCVLGTEAREITPSEIAALTDLASMVMAQIELQHAFGRIDPISGLPNRTQFIDDLLDLARDAGAGELRHLVLVDLIEDEQVSQATRVMGPNYVDDLVRAAAHKITSWLGSSRKAYQVAATRIAFLALPGHDPCLDLEVFETQVQQFAGSSSSTFLARPVVGIAPFQLGQVEPADVLRMAHNAAQDARNIDARVSTYSLRMDEEHRRRYTLIQDFGQALKADDQLRLVFQPRIDIASGVCCGVETLLRWHHPTLGNISPGEFIPMIEATTLAKDLTAWVLDKAVRQAALWQRAGYRLQVSVNVSAANLEEDDFQGRLAQLLGRHGYPVEGLELEVTESAMMSDSGKAQTQLAMLAEMGVCLAIDDFGTGYSSLAYLQRLPAKVVKIDQSFMRGLEGDLRRQELVGTMITLCRKFNYRVVAEGVETAEVLALVAQTGCDEAQGYFFAKPMAPQDLVRWLESEGNPLRKAELERVA